MNLDMSRNIKKIDIPAMALICGVPRPDPASVPNTAEGPRELTRYLDCGILAHGFLRVCGSASDFDPSRRATLTPVLDGKVQCVH